MAIDISALNSEADDMVEHCETLLVGVDHPQAVHVWVGSELPDGANPGWEHAFRANPAVHDPREHVIYVNTSRFNELAQGQQDAVLLHEFGHEVLGTSWELAADSFACDHGAGQAIRDARRVEYGQLGDEYLRLLDLARENPDDAAQQYCGFSFRLGEARRLAAKSRGSGH